MKYFDTIIIGAGLAGCTLANLLLKKNKTVLVIEKQNLKTKDKLCGGLITEKAYKLLYKIYGNKINKINFKKFNSFNVKNNKITKEIKNLSLYTINRKELDDFIVNEFLKNNGIILDNTNYDKIDFKNNIVYISNKKFKYNNLVAADGVFSKVRKDLTGKNQKMNFAVECKKKIKKDIIQIDFLNNFKGYAWTISNNKNTILGLGDVSKNIKINNTFIEYFNLKKDTVRGAFLPTGNNIILKKKNVFFLGDAAGLISPVTGEGIYYALSSVYNLSKSMNSLYKVRMIKDKLIIFSHRISKLLVYNTLFRNFFYKLYGKSKVITFLINLSLKSLL